MKEHYDFSQGKRGAVLQSASNKTRITIRLDGDVVEWFKGRVLEAGGGNYQTLINEALRAHIDDAENRLEETLRRVVREELQHYSELRSTPPLDMVAEPSAPPYDSSSE